MAASAVFAACSNEKNGNKSALSTNDVYGMGAVSSVRLLESNLSAKAVKAFTEVNRAAQARPLVAEGAASTVEDETETELKIRAYADVADKSTYIQMEQEYSVEEGETETEYVYSVYKNGVLLEQTAVEFETENENNKVETEYELEFISGDSKGRYVVEREVKEGKTTIKVKYDIGGKTGVFRISEIIDGNGEKQYEYSYSDGSKKVFD